MIRLTLEFTDNLGPEADLGALLPRLDERLRAAPIGDAHVLVDARVLLDYVSTSEQGGWATLVLSLSAPASLEAAVAPLSGALLDMTEAHLAELFPRHSIALASRLLLLPDAVQTVRRHKRPPGPGF